MGKKKKTTDRIENKPCGCVVTHYKDGTGTLAPCIPCGIMATASALQEAANSLAAVANQTRAAHDISKIDGAIQDMLSKKNAEESAQGEPS